ncbi:MAG: PaaI family thioesterase, partial [Cupriavidus necator]
HGGMLGLFADILISTAAQYQADIPRQFLPTISLQLDFLAGAPLGSWVEGRADILKVTKNLVFSQGIICSDGQPVVRASGVFRRGPLLADSDSDARLILSGIPDQTGR